MDVCQLTDCFTLNYNLIIADKVREIGLFQSFTFIVKQEPLFSFIWDISQ